MLGELIYEAMGKMTATRVLNEDGTVENTLQEQGTIFGIECSATLTMVGTPRPDGIVYSEGYGLMLTKDGDAATLASSAIGIQKGLCRSVAFGGQRSFAHSPRSFRASIT